MKAEKRKERPVGGRGNLYCLCLPQELDRKWCGVAAKAVGAKQLLDLAGDERELEEVSGCLQHLAVLQKAVHTYLDNKRRVFPRFVLMLFGVSCVFL